MKVLLIDREDTYYAGAERMLEHFVAASAGSFELVVALGKGSRVRENVIERVQTIELRSGSKFGSVRLFRQALELAARCREQKIEAVHAWVARDWELAAVVSALAGIPATGTLHDHPAAEYISPARQRIMRVAANFGLRRIVAVSEAVKIACVAAGYRADRVQVIRNGLPLTGREERIKNRSKRALSLGFLGLLSEQKGLRLLFETLDEPVLADVEWQLSIAGEAQDQASRQLKAKIVSKYSNRPWWKRVQWLGWLGDTVSFWQDVDLLLLPSVGFDSFPNVVLEAGFSGVPVMTTDNGGMPEMIRHGETGWLIPRAGWPGEAAKQLAACCHQRELASGLGSNALRFMRANFAIKNMVEAYRQFLTE